MNARNATAVPSARSSVLRPGERTDSTGSANTSKTSTTQSAV